jgi:O-antigen/teichoic acid export membrane protein
VPLDVGDRRELDPTAVRSAQLFAAKVVGNAGYFVAVLLLARGLGPAGRGEIAFLIVTSLILARAAPFGIAEATTVFAAQRPGARAVQLSTAVTFAAATAAAAAIAVGLALLAFVDGGAADIGVSEAVVLAGAAVAVAAAEIGNAFLLGCDRVRQQAVITASSSWIYALLLVLVWASGSLSVVVAAAAWAVAQSLRALWVLSRSLRGLGLSRPSGTVLRESIVFGSRAWIGSIARFLNFRVDQLLMAFIASASALGIYAVAVNAAEVLLYFPSTTAVALLPLAARSDPLRRVEVVLRAFRSAALVTTAGALVAAILGPALIPLVFGTDYDASVTPFLWLLPGAVGFAAMGVFSSALVASSLPGRSSTGPVVSLVVGFALALTLIPPYGPSGAAAASTLAFLAGGLAALATYRRHAPFAWSSLLLPRRGDLDVFRALVPRVARPGKG